MNKSVGPDVNYQKYLMTKVLTPLWHQPMVESAVLSSNEVDIDVADFSQPVPNAFTPEMEMQKRCVYEAIK